MSTATKAAHDKEQKDAQRQIDESNERGRVITEHRSSTRPTVGRILHFYFTDQQIAEIDRRRRGNRVVTQGSTLSKTLPYPLMVVRVMENEIAEGRDGVHGQVYLDGDDTFFVASVAEGTGPGEWRWPPRF